MAPSHSYTINKCRFYELLRLLLSAPLYPVLVRLVTRNKGAINAIFSENFCSVRYIPVCYYTFKNKSSPVIAKYYLIIFFCSVNITFKKRISGRAKFCPRLLLVSGETPEFEYRTVLYSCLSIGSRENRYVYCTV